MGPSADIGATGSTGPDRCHSDEVRRSTIIRCCGPSGPGWRVSLVRSNYRPERCFVEIERSVDEDGVSRGASDSPTTCRAERLFDTTVRAVRLVTTGQVEAADWVVAPDEAPVVSRRPPDITSMGA
jgi:hypothetical protein